MLFRIRAYILLVTLELVTLFAFWSWWTFPERTLFDVYRDMGVIESLQLIFLSVVGLSACFLSRYQAAPGENPLFDFSFGQFIGACCFLLLFRELDYYMTEFMTESQFLTTWTVFMILAAIYAMANIKRILLGLREFFRSRAFWFLLVGASLYLIVAQIVGTKQFRNMFFPHSINFSRRYLEESLELIGIFLMCFGMLEMYIQVKQRLPLRSKGEVTSWTEELWRSFGILPQEERGGSFAKKNSTVRGGSQMTIEQRTLPRGPAEISQSTVVLPERVSRQLEELVYVAQKLRRSNSSFAAVILFIGICLVAVLLWLGFIYRENAIEQSTNVQVAILAQDHLTQPPKWREKHPFRHHELRWAIREELEQEYNFANLFERSPHRDNP